MNESNRSHRPGSLLRTIGLGLLVLAVGTGLALLLLPEWKVGKFRHERVYRQRFRDLAARAGLRLEPGEPRVRLGSLGHVVGAPYRTLGEEGDEWLEATGAAALVEVVHEIAQPDGRKLLFFAEITPDGRCWGLALWPTDFMDLAGLASGGTSRRSMEGLTQAMLGSGEKLGPSRKVQASIFSQSLTWHFFEIHARDRRDVPPQYLITSDKGVQLLYRSPGKPQQMTEAELAHQARGFGTQGLSMFLWLMIGAALFVALLAWRRMGAGLGAILAFACLATSTVSPTWEMAMPFFSLFPVVYQTATVFFFWSSAESLLRSRRLDFTTSLDSLRTGRLGPRGGRALLNGFGYGAGVAGLHLGLAALAVTLPGVSPFGLVPKLPVFRLAGGPLTEGVLLAAGVTLGTALASRFLPPRWGFWGAPALAAWFVPITLTPLPASVAARLALAGVLVHVLRTHGLAALLTASLVTTLFPAAIWTGLHAGFLPGSFAVTAIPLVAIVVLGALGLQRPADVDAAAQPPRFVRRLEESRRRRYETDLLARMHARMLPPKMPEVPGCEVAVRAVLSGSVGGNLYDVLRDEAGGVWVASGDVLGQGYACSIAQAMVKAALHSLVASQSPPAEVLRQTSAVLRGVDPQRNVATLVLVRIVPGTGECRLANAGHPTPLLVAGGEVSALQPAGARLGEETIQAYEDAVFELPPGGLLVFVSETVFEERDRKGVPFGMENVRAVLRANGGRTAEEVLEALLASWRRHVGPRPPSDDTTVVVVRRSALEGTR